MKAASLLLMLASVCFASDVSGVWALKHAAVHLPACPIAVQVTQVGDRVQVLKIVSTPLGRRVEQVWLEAAAIRTLAKTIELTVGLETWTISADGRLKIDQIDSQPVVLEPAERVVQ